VTRQYTPVPSDILDLPSDASHTSENIQTFPQKLHFIIKVYPDGTLTKQLDKLRLNTGIIEIGCVGGNLNLLEFLSGGANLVLLAGGTGITPFIKILQSVLFNSRNRFEVGKIILLFFNESERDIIWRNELESLSLKFPNSFYFYPVISKPISDSWTGFSGRVSPQLLDICFQKVNLLGVTKAMICGSYSFNDSCKQ